MKRIFKLFLCALAVMLLVLTVAACDENGGENAKPSDYARPENVNTDDTFTPTGKILVAYFSWSTSGNTERMANYIAERTGAAVWEIVPAAAYPDEYTPTTEVAKAEKDANARPAIKNPLTAEQIKGYDAVFVGFPIWWHAAPMIIGTFLESYEWTAEVDIYPFFQGASNSNESYYTETMTFINGCVDGASVHEGLYAASTNTAAINAYLAANGFAAH